MINCHRRRRGLPSSSLVLLSLILSSLTIRLHAAAAAAANNDDGLLSDIKCFSGWTVPEEVENLQQQPYIPKSWINDGYCDCPFGDGNDEPNTNACSGSKSWPGINRYVTI
jgi:hypothetical protein